ncbi:MAG: anaerobic ribonucleoside-triphosphate reductase activating protein [Clostridia bacterium]|nr:anaerobic ribonucleoside-triphosphate reductase activating protein [Clostridia bacterium]
MLIKGLAKLTLLDYPGCVACTVFTGGCNFKCPFCHNASLALRAAALPSIPEEEVFELLRRRRGILDGICVSGGEPLLHPDLPEFLKKIKALGYRIKLDTNGAYPDRLGALIDHGLIDMVAMDIKNAPDKYPLTVGLPSFDMAPVRESAALLMRGTLPYEFRTTVVREFHEKEDFEAIGTWIRGAAAYYLQSFTDSGDVIKSNLHAHTAATLEVFLATAKKYVSNTQLRGI